MDNQPLSLNTPVTPAFVPNTPSVDVNQPGFMRAIDDTDGLKNSVYDSVLEAAAKMPPIVGKNHIMRLTNVSYAEEDPMPDKTSERTALLAKASVTRKLRGTWLLEDLNGNVIDQKRQVVANVPHVFNDGSIVLRGTRYVAGLQQRLRPGIYTRRRKNGESEAHFNIKTGTGPSHRYILEPDTGRFMFNLQHSRVPLPSLLEALGAKREDMEQVWGKDVTALNYAKSDPKALAKIYERLVPKREQNVDDMHSPDNMKTKIATAFSKMEVDDEVVNRTLGMVTGGKVTPQAILTATKKVLDLSKGDVEQDDRDHPAFATYHDLADIMSERLRNDYARMRQQMLYKVANKGSLKSLPSGWLDKQLNTAVFNSGLVNSIEEINPLETLDRLTRITRYGEGGLSGSTSTPKEARAVNPGHFGFLDTSRTVESLRVGVDVNAARHAYLGKDRKLYAPFVDMKTGERVFRSPDQIADSTMVIGKSAIDGYDVAVAKGKLKVVKSGTGDYKADHYENFFSHLANLAPMKSAMFAQRGSMASRMSVAGESQVLIYRANGNTYYGSIADYEWQEGDRSYSVDKDTCQIELKPVVAKITHKNVKRMYKVTTNTGKTVVATHDHSFVTAGDSGRLEKIHTQDVLGVSVPTVGDSHEVVWAVVVSVDEVDAANYEYVYDLDMADNVFLCNGIFVHNTTQALPLEYGESPLVGTALPLSDGDSFENKLGTVMGAMRAKERANVLSVTPDYIELAYVGGKKEKVAIDNYRPTARKSYIHNTAMVRPGDTVEPGQLLAKSNFTDNEGKVALGINARTALMPYGENWEDAFIISDKLAERMRIQTAYKHYLDKTQGDIVGKKPFLSVYGMMYPKKKMDNIDDDGVVTPGTVVHKGDPLVLSMRSKAESGGRVHKKGAPNYSNGTLTWDHEHEGVVTHVYKDEKGYNVMVKSTKNIEESDKLSGRQGNKGTVRILPEAQMPRDANGEPLEALVSPLAVISRGNSSFPLEMALGKLAALRGKPYYIDDFSGKSLRKFVDDELKTHNVKDKETLYDPNTGRKISNVLTGRLYIMALHHLAESKGSGRGIGSYTSTDEPAKGKGQAKRLSGQELFANMSQGAYKFNAEASLLRGRRNDDFWSAFMRGHEVATPKVNPVYDGFLDRLKSVGINPVRRGTKTQLLAMTDKDVEQLTGNREVTSHETVNIHKDLSPIDGGLFDPKIFGDGTKFGMIKLAEPTLNPVFEDPMRKILGLTESKLRNVLAGKEDLGTFGTGPQAIIDRFKKTNLDDDIEKARQEIAGTKKTARDAAIKRLGYLKALKNAQMTPADLMVTSVPVLPPRFRPISRLGNKGNVVVNDANFLYRELMLANDNVKGMGNYVEHPAEERLALYDAYKSLVGLSDPAQYELRSRGVKGLLKTISGTSPKTGYVQRRLLSTTVDNVGRGVIVPDTRLDMNSVGLPINMAMKSFQPYVVHKLVRRGINPVDALDKAKNRDQDAIQALTEVMAERPVVMSRAPVLHRYGILGLESHLVPGSSIKLNPFVYKGMTADNDGDALNFHVPHGKDVVDEIRNRMMPDKMLISQNDMKTPAFAPQQDHLLGLYMASNSRKDNARTKYFAKLSDAIAAFKRGQLDVDDVVSITEK